MRLTSVKGRGALLRALALALMAGAFATGCAGVIEFKMPREFEGKKIKEDPPKSMAPLVPNEACA